MGFAEIGQRLVYIQQCSRCDVDVCGDSGMDLKVRTRFDRRVRTDASVTGYSCFMQEIRIDLFGQ